MLREDSPYVALFIDWDNLAISTTADLGGVIPGIVPEINTVVKVAQRYGTVLVARAYSEWTSSTDRLTIYRAGVEPVYAPTFRFEPDPVNQAPRGKSLADPCLVADCVDTMHLMPEISVLVLVSGDKDLIPIVRLAQLRGKRVVVVGPDYAAAILKDMADEYIAYRSLIEVPEGAPAPEPAGSRRRRPNGTIRQPQTITTAPPLSAPASRAHGRAATPPPAPVNAAEAPAPVAAPAPAPARRRETPIPPAPVVEEPEPALAVPAVETERVEAQEDIAPVFELVKNILRERESQGRPRLRATNLKDQLLARISGFNERRYGFSRFKDFLTAAERAGVLSVHHAGPVQWITLPESKSTPAPTVAAPATTEPAAVVEATTESPVSVSPSPAPAAEAAPSIDALLPEEERGGGIVRYIADLRNRSKWITFTYVLTNLMSHYERWLPTNLAETEARNVLNRLVQEGILRVDREPREIEVGGARHRVRLCHLEEEHPAVQQALAELAAEQAAQQATAETAPDAPVADVPSTPAETAPEAPEASTNEAEAPAAHALDAEAAEAPPVTTESETAPAEEAPREETMVAEPASSTAAEESSPSETEAPGEAATDEADPTEESSAPLTLPDAFARLQEVVRAATSPEKPLAGAANVKTRLSRMLGAFDEHQFGFSKFKDFLLAAEREGFVRIETSGPVTRVGLPDGATETTE